MACARRAALAAAGVLLAAGCSTKEMDGVVCSAVFVSGVVVEVRDSVSGAPLGGARGVVREGAYMDSLRPNSYVDVAAASTLQAAGERAGTYTVELVRPGYRAFTTSGVVVTRDACHVRPETVRAALAPGA